VYINQRLQIQFVAPDDERCAGAVCRSKHVEPSINFGIINSTTKLHLVGISIESYYDARIYEYQIYKFRIVGLQAPNKLYTFVCGFVILCVFCCY